MRDYRLYCLDGAKRIQRAADLISASDDDQALEQATALGLAMVCELWEGHRLVATISAAKA
jgi:hypothetical protein